MRNMLAGIALGLALAPCVARAADAAEAAAIQKSAEIRTGWDLLGKLASPAEQECGMGYVMGVYGVQSGKGALPSAPAQKQIAELVKKELVAVTRGRLDRSANELVQEILEKNKAKLQAITARADSARSSVP